MPEEKKNSGPRESRMLINARGEEKIRLKVIERAHQCPRRRKNQAQGNREGSSMPKEAEKPSLRESRKLIDNQEGEKTPVQWLLKRFSKSGASQVIFVAFCG
jgi:hypothetical protein